MRYGPQHKNFVLSIYPSIYQSIYLYIHSVIHSSYPIPSIYLMFTLGFFLTPNAIGGFGLAKSFTALHSHLLNDKYLDK